MEERNLLAKAQTCKVRPADQDPLRQGIVVSFNLNKGWGFIRESEEYSELFVNRRDVESHLLKGHPYRDLYPGDKVTFTRHKGKETTLCGTLGSKGLALQRKKEGLQPQLERGIPNRFQADRTSPTPVTGTLDCGRELPVKRSFKRYLKPISSRKLTTCNDHAATSTPSELQQPQPTASFPIIFYNVSPKGRVLFLLYQSTIVKMLQALAQRPAPANTNRDRRPRYQHPKGAPNADLIFKTGGRRR
ncbi:unnamed protein product [Ranitomeya imitator]|uniref:CSD domain-containing protein n=1 Tax=Ranitomeya imitator TaxID=111125 RepID=A0ABN9KTJ8_9NEOB|nr:unnamed protein product [Ranitomeya imitator]